MPVFAKLQKISFALVNYFILHFPSAHLVPSITPNGPARIFLLQYAAAGIQTIGRVAPIWDLLKDTFTTELLRCGYWSILNP